MKKGLKISLVTIGALVGSLVICAGGYVGYIILSYSRIGDKELNINKRSSSSLVKKGEEYSLTSYNIGFGAYSQDFTFFLDTGYDEKGKATCGYYSKAKSKDETPLEFQNGGFTSKPLKLNSIVVWRRCLHLRLEFMCLSQELFPYLLPK